MKTLLAEDIDLTVCSLYQKLSFIIKSYKDSLVTEDNSQVKVVELQTYLFSTDEIINYIKPLIDDLTAKCFRKSVVQNIKLKCIKMSQTSEVVENSDDESDNFTDSEDEVSKIFDSIKSDTAGKNDEKKKKKIVQSFSVFSNGKQKVLNTPGEWGSHVVEIKITDTRDLKGVLKDDYWKKVSQKAVFLVKSAEDKNFKELNRIVQQAGKNIASTVGVTKEIKKSYRNRPY